MNDIKTIKVKITNNCMNNCRFCIFHDRTDQISYEDIVKICNAIPITWNGQLIINGGEPTIHKDFIKISDYIRKSFPENRFGLGTNLRLFEKETNRTHTIFESMINNYDLFQIGCDVEHRNIQIVEKLVPVLRKYKKDVYINCIEEFSSKLIINRLLELNKTFGSHITFSPVHDHNQHKEVKRKNIRMLCNKRQNDILIDADGELYFCFKQSFEKSEGNMNNMNNTELYNVFFDIDIDYMYDACIKCPYYE